MDQQFWTNPSVLTLGADPIAAITFRARSLVFRALENGWQGPPFDPFALAQLLKIETAPTSEVLDAKILPLSSSRYRIEFNPDRPRRRMRYSISHEIAHTLLDDCAEMIRHRGVHNASRPDDWQLEMLCNLAAGELLLPAGTLRDSGDLRPSIDTVLELRSRYEVSAEAALLRVRELTTEPAAAFACHRDRATGRYLIDYALSTATGSWNVRAGSSLPSRTVASECTAIGYTAKSVERWPRIGNVRLECVGVAPYPRDIHPRVIGFMCAPTSEPQRDLGITFLRGDATRIRGIGPKLLLQVVNDAAFSWGGGFAIAVRKRWPSAQSMFSAQARANTLRLGDVITSELEPDVTLVSLIAQHGYGPSLRPRIRYGALTEAIQSVRELAMRTNASIHMPRIGTGQAGGAWPVVEEIVRAALVTAGIKVFVYDLPQGQERAKAQHDLAFSN